MSWFGRGSSASSSSIGAQDLAYRFQSRKDWSGMTPKELRTALEWGIRQQIYPQATQSQWEQILPRYKNQIDYAMYCMCCAQFPFEDRPEWSLDESNAHFANKTFDGNAKHNCFVGYLNAYFYRYINSIELQNLRFILAVNEGISIENAVDYFLTLIVFADVVAANPNRQFEYHQISGVPASRVQALEDLRNKIIVAYNNDDEVALFKHVYYAMTYFAGSVYRGVHKVLIPLLGYDDLGQVREMFYQNVPSIIKNKGNVAIGGFTC